MAADVETILLGGWCPILKMGRKVAEQTQGHLCWSCRYQSIEVKSTGRTDEHLT